MIKFSVSQWSIRPSFRVVLKGLYECPLWGQCHGCSQAALCPWRTTLSAWLTRSIQGKHLVCYLLLWLHSWWALRTLSWWYQKGIAMIDLSSSLCIISATHRDVHTSQKYSSPLFTNLKHSQDTMASKTPHSLPAFCLLGLQGCLMPHTSAQLLTLLRCSVNTYTPPPSEAVLSPD